jgi:site-specific DNA-methyltransferase (adenine-specific)
MGLINDDCMNILPKYEDNYFDLAIVDPPYGIKRFGDRVEIEVIETKINEWDIKPSPEYFKELFRVSKNQIIWGANNFTLPNTEYFIIWDKQQTVDNFASAEFAWTNIKKPAKVFRHSIHKVMASRKQEKGKIHPTQKPVELYRWLLENYAQPTDMILDTHLGSGSSAIACHYFGIEEFVGIEIDKEYFDNAKTRIEKETRQIKLL